MVTWLKELNDKEIALVPRDGSPPRCGRWLLYGLELWRKSGTWEVETGKNYHSRNRVAVAPLGGYPLVEIDVHGDKTIGKDRS